MASQQQLEFAIKAVNESEAAFKEITSDLGDVREEAGKAAKEVGGFGEKLNATAEAGGDAEQALRGVNDLAGVMGDQFGVSLGPMGQYTQALMDVGGGVEALLKGAPAFLSSMGAMTASTWAQVTALYAQAAAWVAANAPILIIIGTIALLAAGVYLLVQHWDTITEKVPILGAAFEAVKGAIQGFVGFVTGTLVPAIKDPIGALQAVKDWATSNWPEIATILSGPFAPIVLLATDAFGVRSALTGAFTGALDWVRSNWPEIASVISGPFFPLVALATDAFGIRSALTGAFDAALDYIRNLAGTAWEAAKNVGVGMKDGILTGLKGIVSNVAEIAGAFQDALKDAINAALRWAHDHISISIPGFDPPGPGEIPGFDWSFPLIQLAKGGIVTRPTLALVGESGPEAVVPLSRGGAGGLGNTVIIQTLDARSFRDWLSGNPEALDTMAYELQRRVGRA